MAKQKDAVFSAIVALRGTSVFTGPVELSKDERASVTASLLDGLKSGSIDYQGDLKDTKKLNMYVSGLISNWLRKDPRLNGNTKYVPKNPGTRTGSNDDSIKAMKQLRESLDDEDAKAEIDAHIAARQAELKPKPVINVDALPDSLKHLVQ